VSHGRIPTLDRQASEHHAPAGNGAARADRRSAASLETAAEPAVVRDESGEAKKVLLVTYTFPPQYDVSSRRTAKLCKYLPRAGWQPVVLTKDWSRDVAPEDARAYTLVQHAAALDEIAGVRIVRAPYRSHDNALRRLHRQLGGVYEHASRDLSAINAQGLNSDNATDSVAGNGGKPRSLTRRALSLFSPLFGDFPDAFRGWIAPAVSAGVDVVRREAVDAICSVCPPATAHVVASEIARRTGLPWVAQFDDLYSFHLERERRAVWRRYANYRHRRWLRRATMAGAITPDMLRYVRTTYGLDGEVVVVGFDPDDQPHVAPPARNRFQIAYTGSVYPGDQRPEIFFDAIERLCARGFASPLEVVFAGTGCDEELRARLTSFPNAERVCVFIDRLSPADALRLQRQADALLLLNCTNPSPDEGTLSYPAKAFEYFNARRPILALPRDPGGWGDRLLQTTGTGVTADTAADAADLLESWVAAWQTSGSVPYRGDVHEIDRYSQPRQAQALARLLDRALTTYES